jgi:hypothetical protein
MSAFSGKADIVQTCRNCLKLLAQMRCNGLALFYLRCRVPPRMDRAKCYEDRHCYRLLGNAATAHE